MAEYINESLSKKDPKKEKQVVLMDFVSTGATIDLIKQIINEYCNVPWDLIKKCSLNELIGSVPLNIKGCGAGGFLYDISRSKVEYISNTPHYVICGRTVDFDKENEKTEYKMLKGGEHQQCRPYQLIVMNELELKDLLIADKSI